MVLCHHFSIRHDFLDIKVLQGIHKKNIRNSSRTNGAYQMVDSISLRTIDGSHLNGCHGIHPGLHSQSYHIVQMPFT